MLWCPASAITVRMFGNNGANPPSNRTAAFRSEMSAGSTLHAISSPKMSTTIWRLRPFTRLCASKPRMPPRSVVLYRLTIHDDDGGTNGSSGLPSYLLVHLSAGDKSRHHRSSRTESSGRPCSTMETLEEANAIGSLFVANRRWHSRQREGWFCAVGHRSVLPAISARSATRLHRSNLYRRAYRHRFSFSSHDDNLDT